MIKLLYAALLADAAMPPLEMFNPDIALWLFAAFFLVIPAIAGIVLLVVFKSKKRRAAQNSTQR